MRTAEVGQFDRKTGEVLEGSMVVFVAQRPRIKERFVMTFQDGLMKLAADRDITGEQWRVVAYLIGTLDFENYIHIPQAQIAEALNLRAPNVSRSIKKLIEKGVLLRGPKVRSITTLRLSPTLGWKGNAKSLHSERAKRFQLVKGGKAQPEQPRLIDD